MGVTHKNLKTIVKRGLPLKAMECAFSRDKRLFGGRLRAKKAEAQEREAAIACGLLNRMREWGRPQSYRVG
jgi:hypothetical protein